MDLVVFFFFNDTATTEIYTLSLHDALPISCVRHPAGAGGTARRTRCARGGKRGAAPAGGSFRRRLAPGAQGRDRKSTRLNSSHGYISYAVFCLKKKNTTTYSISNNSTAADF